MNALTNIDRADEALRLASALAIEGRHDRRPLDPHSSPEGPGKGLDIPLPRHGRDPVDVIRHLDLAARPGISGTTKAGFLSWVIGGSHPAGIAADWLAASWGQNACLHDSAPAACEAEAASAAWLLDVLHLPKEASVGFTTGATMAAFTALAAARLAVLERAGHDFEESGLMNCPEVAIYICDDAHVTNFSVLRYLGFGSGQIRLIPSIEDGTYDLDALERRMRTDNAEARIVVSQAGQIMSGAFDNFTRLSSLCRQFNAWLHIDGAFGLWIRASDRLRVLAHNADLADSWSVDGHKWLQIPYDCGFAIVRHEKFHRRAMAMQAGYLPEMPIDRPTVRNNSDYVPELSRRARGFAVWAVMQSLGRRGISDLVESHCDATHRLALALRQTPGIQIVNRVALNQLALTFDTQVGDGAEPVARYLNASGRYFVRTASWQGRKVLRLSITCGATTAEHIQMLVSDILSAWDQISRMAA